MELHDVERAAVPAPGPLVVSGDNPRYLSVAGDGRVVYLTGARFNSNLQDGLGLGRDCPDEPERFDFEAYLEFLVAHGHNPTHTGSTTGAGKPAPSDRESLTIGPNGPLLLHDVHFIEQMAHFNREKVPERQPHAKGSGAFGVFETTEDVSQYTKAALFQPGVTTELLIRFSTVAGEMGSPDTWRDVRGFSLKFYTSAGNYDLVGNNTPVFFVRDPMKFPHFIRSQRRCPTPVCATTTCSGTSGR